MGERSPASSRSWQVVQNKLMLASEGEYDLEASSFELSREDTHNSSDNFIRVGSVGSCVTTGPPLRGPCSSTIRETTSTKLGSTLFRIACVVGLEQFRIFRLYNNGDKHLRSGIHRGLHTYYEIDVNLVSKLSVPEDREYKKIKGWARR